MGGREELVFAKVPFGRAKLESEQAELFFWLRQPAVENFSGSLILLGRSAPIGVAFRRAPAEAAGGSRLHSPPKQGQNGATANNEAVACACLGSEYIPLVCRTVMSIGAINC